jgi:hypothetical protein
MRRILDSDEVPAREMTANAVIRSIKRWREGSRPMRYVVWMATLRYLIDELELLADEAEEDDDAR